MTGLQVQSHHAAARGPHRLAVATAAVTVVLVFVGGVVTNTGSALAVPDWPTTFGHNMFLYPWSQMVGGIFYEHTHRLLGSLVGLLTVSLAVWLWIAEPRRWVRRLGLLAVVAVIIQGILGGMRVVLLQYSLAIVHGCFAHAFLALMVVLAVSTAPGWHDVWHQARLSDARQLRSAALATVAVLYVQIVFGALLTHAGTRVDAHIAGAVLAVVAVCITAARALRCHGDRAELRRPALLLLILLGAQLLLGVGAYLARFTALRATLSPAMAVTLPTTHRALGALLFATAVVFATRVLRASASAQPAWPAQQNRLGHVAQDLATGRPEGALA